MLMHYEPFRPFEHLWRQPSAGFRGAVMPTDAYRRDDAFVFELDLPGVDEDSIDVTVEDGVLQVVARRTASYRREDQILATERSHGQVTRRFLLDRAVAADRIEASYHAGVLVLTVPLADEAKPRKIAIDTNGHKAVAASSA